MILTHWSHKPIENLRNVQPGPISGPARKPKGVWLSDESDEISWSVWCRENRWGKGAVRTDFSVEMQNVIHLSDIEAMTAFAESFSCPPDRFGSREIDWVSVSRHFAGILITPYRDYWAGNNDLNWHYGWDCASGCFWDVSCLSRISRSPPVSRSKAARRYPAT